MNRFLRRIILAANNHGFLWFLGDKACIKLVFHAQLNKKLNLKEPETFNEKLQWIKLYDRNPLYTVMADKYAVREYVKENIGEEYSVPLLGVWDNPDDIDFSKLPNRFVLKCTHDSGGIVICADKDKLNTESAVKFLKKRLKKSGSRYGREWPYKNIKRKVIAEQFLKDDETDELRDYKLHFFGGEIKFILVCSERQKGLKEDFFTPNWEHIPVKRPTHGHSESVIAKPASLEKMIELGAALAKDIPFLRVDFYVVNGKIYFGETTFFPASGYTAFVPEKYDTIFGGYLKLPAESD